MKNTIAVIGAGVGGSITAYNLAKAGFDTTLFEEGKSSPSEPFSLEELSLKYRNKGQTITFGRPKVKYVEASCIGGGSEINSGLYHRLPQEVLRLWSKEFDIQQLEEADLENHYKFFEEYLSIATNKNSITSASEKILQGAHKLSWKAIEVPRWFDNNNTRMSMSRTCISDFLKYGGKLLSNTKITGLKKRGNFWELCTSSGTDRFQNIFLCAGAIQTPYILRRSGIKKNVGNSLSMHPTIKLTAHFSEKVNGPAPSIPVHQVKEFSPKISIGGSISSLPHLMSSFSHHPDFPHYFQSEWEHLFTYYAMITPKGRGKVRSFYPFKDPYVSFKMDSSDLKNLQLARKYLAKLLLESGANLLLSTHGEKYSSLEEVVYDSSVWWKDLMTIHLFGSCPMGENKQLCATDSFGKLHGLEGLYINDASLFGGPPGVNPQGGIMAISRRNAFHFINSK